jgi:NDP-sugar pyrophosphorylase family protein/aminoglycoside/choline kinase family phosphotransferase
MRMIRPTKAVVLAAGFGTRMLPLSRDLPKPLMPLWGVPILERILNLLKRWGVKEVVINLHHNPDEIFALGRSLARADLKINFSFEPEILGTGGALRRAEWFIGDDPFWLINSDIVAELKPDALIKAFASGKCLSAAWLHPTLGPRTVEMSKGWIMSFQSRTPGAKGTFTFCGLHLVSPRILKFLPESGFAGIIPAYERAMKQGLRVAGVCVPGSFWADIGTPQQYLDAHREMKKGRGSFSASGRGVIRERNVRVSNSVIWDGAILRAGSVIENAIVGRGADVAGKVGYIAMRADRALERPEQQALTAFGMNPQHATVFPMGPRGSERTFTRICCYHGALPTPPFGHPSRGGELIMMSPPWEGSAKRGVGSACEPQSVILMRYSLKREENGLYCGHSKLLAKISIPVPRVLLDWPEHNLGILEDLGQLPLNHAIAGRPAATARKLYRRVIDAMVVFQEKGSVAVRREHRPLMPPFGEGLYRWERDYFARYFLAERLHLPARQIEEIKKDLAHVAARLLKAPRTLIHRDLQSSNILIESGRPYFIDFQGMRLGAAAYDLASLLCDPYVSLEESFQESLLGYYARRSANPDPGVKLFWWAAIERLAQALGAYARLGALPGMQSFNRHIAPAVAMTRRALNHVDGLRSLRSFVNGLPNA